MGGIYRLEKLRALPTPLEAMDIRYYRGVHSVLFTHMSKECLLRTVIN